MDQTIPFVKQFSAKRPMREELLQRARDIWKSTGPICSGEGLYQHIGECWNDAVSMVLLYTDGIKEKVQEQLLTGDLQKIADRIRTHERFTLNYKKQVAVPTLFNVKTVERIKLYLETLQSRFVRQILNQYVMEENSKLQHGPFRAHGVNALTSAITAALPAISRCNPLFDVGIPDYESLTHNDYKRMGGYYVDYLIPVLLHVLDLNYIIEYRYIIPEKRHGIPHLDILSLGEISNIAALNISIETPEYMHQVCMYTCNGIDYFYDNEIGVFHVPWRFLFRLDSSNIFLFVEYHKDNTVAPSVIPLLLPAVYNPTEKKLIIVNPADTTKFLVLDWDGVTKSMEWRVGDMNVKQLPNLVVISQLSYDPELKPDELTYADKLDPVAVGRGVYRSAYAPFDEAAAIASLQAVPIAPTNSKKGGARRTRRARKGRSRKQRR